MNDSTVENLVLSCIVPEGMSPVKIFLVRLESENRCFEVITPHEARSGQLINIIVPQQPNTTTVLIHNDINTRQSSNNNLWDFLYEMSQLAITRTKTLDRVHKVSDKLTMILNPVITRIHTVDTIFQISNHLQDVSHITKQKLMDIDTKYTIMNKTSYLYSWIHPTVATIDSNLSITMNLMKFTRTLCDTAITADDKYNITDKIAYYIAQGVEIIADNISSSSSSSHITTTSTTDTTTAAAIFDNDNINCYKYDEKNVTAISMTV